MHHKFANKVISFGGFKLNYRNVFLVIVSLTLSLCKHFLFSQDYTIKHYLKSGADRDKLVLGIPTYGRSYTLFNPESTDIGAPADGPGEQGDATREKGYLAYYEVSR